MKLDKRILVKGPLCLCLSLRESLYNVGLFIDDLFGLDVRTVALCAIRAEAVSDGAKCCSCLMVMKMNLCVSLVCCTRGLCSIYR